jgi:hypothetical protein
MCCDAVRRRGTTIRHNWVVHTLNRYARLAGASCSLEPRPFLDDDRQRPDLSFTHLQTTFTDVVVVQPDAPSRGSASPQSVLFQAESLKEKKYSDKLAALGHSFIAAAASCHGVFSNSLVHLIDVLSALHAENFPNSDMSPSFRRCLVEELACAIQKGNARILRDAVHSYQQFKDSPAYSAAALRSHSDAALLFLNRPEPLDDGLDPDEQSQLDSLLSSPSSPSAFMLPLPSSPIFPVAHPNAPAAPPRPPRAAPRARAPKRRRSTGPTSRSPSPAAVRPKRVVAVAAVNPASPVVASTPFQFAAPPLAILADAAEIVLPAQLASGAAVFRDASASPPAVPSVVVAAAIDTTPSAQLDC